MQRKLTGLGVSVGRRSFGASGRRPLAILIHDVQYRAGGAGSIDDGNNVRTGRPRVKTGRTKKSGRGFMTGSENGGRARAYEALRASEELHRATLSSISDAVFMADDTGAFTYICPNVDVIFGFVPDEVQAMGSIDRLLGENLFDP